MSPIRTARQRPAETAGAGATVVALVVAVTERNTLAAVTALVGLVPAACTFVVENGGLREVLARLWRGYRAP